MEEFGICFRVTGSSRFQQLCSLFNEIKRDKDAEDFRAPEMWLDLIPDDVKNAFSLLTSEERSEWQRVRFEMVISVASPSEQIGGTWVFDRVFESIEECDYSLLCCQMVEADVAEIHIDPNGYPYGGVGALIALTEAFGFFVLGVNECGRYESREQLCQG
jgi:hypothetical protein